MKKVLSILNLIIPIISFIILFFFDYSDNIIYIIIMTLFIGWLIPFINLLITGISILKEFRPKLTMIFNIFNALLNGLIIFLIISLYEKKFLLMLIEYSIFLALNIINTIYLYKKIPKKDKEDEEIKKIKKENNGVIK